MSRSVLLTGLVLILFGAGVFLWKALLLDLPLTPRTDRGIWQVHLEVTVRGDATDGSVRVALPSPGPRQRVFGESFASGRLRLAVREEQGARLAVWHGWIEGTARVLYDFRVQVFPMQVRMPEAPYAAPGPTLRERYTSSAVGLPASAPEIREQLRALDLPGPEDVGARVRTIFAFVNHEIGEGESSGDDPLLVLAQSSGSPRGREHLLATLLRGAGIPARLMQGLQLQETRPRRLLWTEVWVNDLWVPMSVSADFFEKLPPDTLVLNPGSDPLVSASGVREVGWGFSALRERLSRQELATLMVPPNRVLRQVSLHRLSVPMQSALRILLLLPVGALVIAVMRNLVGMDSFGTFMPMLIALSMRGTGLLLGLLMLVLVITIGVLGRLVLGRLRLLLVPRLSILMCIVILCVGLLGLVGRGIQNPDFYAGIVFPIVILTMVVERFSIVMAEEGLREALKRGFSSIVLAVIVYPLFSWGLLEHLMFGFPELVFCVMGLLVLMGGYSGYRLSDLVRFRVIVAGDRR